jgi:hypothetical protein
MFTPAWSSFSTLSITGTLQAHPQSFVSSQEVKAAKDANADATNIEYFFMFVF